MRKALQHYLDHIAPYVTAVHGDTAIEVADVCCDSRQVGRNALFVAVAGARDNGVRYIAQALAAGATVIVAAEPVTVPEGIVVVEVTQTYAVLARLAEVQYDFPARKLKMFGITGTNGKTTTAYILRAIFREAGLITGMLGTVCYDCGDAEIAADRTTPPPLLLQRLLAQMVQAAVQVVIVEMSSHALVQHRYGAGRAAGAIFTNLTGDHLDYHHTLEEYFRAKQRLFTEVLDQQATAVVNIDDPAGQRLAAELRAAGRSIIGFSTAPNAAPWVACMQGLETDVTGTRLHLVRSDHDQSLCLQSPMIGLHNAYNIVGAALLALDAGIDPAVIQRAVASCRGAPGRLEAFPTSTGATIFVDYAHTDDALQNVLDALRRLQPRRLSVVFGCGGDRDRSKRARMGRVAAALADQVWVTNDNPRSEDPRQIIAEILDGIPASTACHVEPDRRQAIRAAVTNAGKGDLVLIAGKGHENYQEVNGVTLPFDDAEEVRTALAAAVISDQ